MFNGVFIGAALTKLMTFPSIVYVYEDKGIDVVHIKCYNSTNSGTHYSSIVNALWYQHFPNGSQYQITASRPPATVFRQRNVLTFFPRVRRVDQGQYFCCLPGGRAPGDSNCSELVNVSIAGKVQLHNH